jgi:hypothetical protein
MNRSKFDQVTIRLREIKGRFVLRRSLRCIIGWNIVATTEGRTTHFNRRSLATIAGVTIVDAVLPQLVRM